MVERYSTGGRDASKICFYSGESADDSDMLLGAASE
jgi:hypothetical protein